MIKPLRRVDCAAITLLFCASLQARDISGQVTGPGGFPVATATVEAVESGVVTRTDSLGNFTLSGVPEGSA